MAGTLVRGRKYIGPVTASAGEEPRDEAQKLWDEIRQLKRRMEAAETESAELRAEVELLREQVNNIADSEL